mmetsp:Transcript_32110/g.81469  ORF Transcript_32110/g.81469 Transcript_32110/m.81469 type:complete len:296 (-) Transcript_32110:614-1501(-)
MHTRKPRHAASQPLTVIPSPSLRVSRHGFLHLLLAITRCADVPPADVIFVQGAPSRGTTVVRYTALDPHGVVEDFLYAISRRLPVAVTFGNFGLDRICHPRHLLRGVPLSNLRQILIRIGSEAPNAGTDVVLKDRQVIVRSDGVREVVVARPHTTVIALRSDAATCVPAELHGFGICFGVEVNLGPCEGIVALPGRNGDEVLAQGDPNDCDSICGATDEPLKFLDEGLVACVGTREGDRWLNVPSLRLERVHPHSGHGTTHAVAYEVKRMLFRAIEGIEEVLGSRLQQLPNLLVA